MEQKFEYYAFISYKREDEKWAKWLQRKIEGYRLPSTLCKKNPQLPKRLSSIFKDTTDIQPGQLKEELKKNLTNSKYLIVVCSPLSTQSKWVGEEIEYFISLGRGMQIILFIVDGEPYSNDSDKECVHQVIKKHLPEMLGVNVNEKGSDCKYIKREKAFIRVVSKMLNVSFDSLWKRQRRRLIRELIFWIALTTLFFLLLIFVWHINQSYDSRISLREASVRSNNLVMSDIGGVIAIKLDNQRLVDTMFSFDDIAEFHNIPAKYKNKPVSLSFSSPGFYSIDTMVMLHEKLLLSVNREESYYGKVVGMVRSSGSDKLISGATIKVGSQNVITDEEGHFEMIIPLSMQREEYKTTVIYEGEDYAEQTIYPMQNNEMIINIVYVK